MQTKTIISQIASFPHGVGVWVSLNVESDEAVLSSNPLTMHTIVADNPLADQLLILNRVIVSQGWPPLNPDQTLKIEALRAVAATSEADIAALAGQAAVAAAASATELARRNAALEAELAALRSIV